MKSNEASIAIRKATRDDAKVILSLVNALADYEKLTPPNAAAKERLINDMSSERPRFDAYIADVDGKAVGYAFVFETYSSFLALPTFRVRDVLKFPRVADIVSRRPLRPPRIQKEKCRLRTFLGNGEGSTSSRVRTNGMDGA
ncbi:MAG: Acetyltransferase family protein [Bacteroidetes bacterium]|nr:Acetyltransferase family protein [Bacteroidota bacterium]